MSTKTSKFIKFLLLTCVIIYGTWIFIGLINKNKQIPVSNIQEYNASDIKAYKQHCMQTLAIRFRYPEITKAYCDCYVEEVVKKFTKKQLEEIGSKSARVRDSLLNDVITGCAKATGRDTLR